MKKIILILTSVLVLLVLAAAPLATAGPVIDWWAVGASSASLSSGEITLESSVGQGITGQAGSGLYNGYLSLFAEFLGLIYMPLILR